jgi:hypothetical protein
MSVGTLEEMIDDNHAIVSSPMGPEFYVNILSFVDKDSIEPGCTVLLHNKVCFFILIRIHSFGLGCGVGYGPYHDGASRGRCVVPSWKFVFFWEAPEYLYLKLLDLI